MTMSERSVRDHDWCVWIYQAGVILMVIHAFNKSGRHLEFLIYDVIRGKTSATILEVWLAWQYHVRAPERQSQAIMNRFIPFFSNTNINKYQRILSTTVKCFGRIDASLLQLSLVATSLTRNRADSFLDHWATPSQSEKLFCARADYSINVFIELLSYAKTYT